MKLKMRRIILLFILYVLGTCMAQNDWFQQEDFTSEDVHIGDVDYGFDEISFWDKSYWANGRLEDKEQFQAVPTLESLAKQTAELISTAYSRTVPVQPSDNTIKKINMYFNPSDKDYISAASGEAYDVDAFGNSAESRAVDQREIISDMFKFNNVDESSHGRRAIAIPSFPNNHTLGPACATKYCELLQTALSCKAFQIDMSKICAKHFVGLIFSCPGFPDKYHLQDAPISCQVEFANAAAQLQLAATNLQQSAVFKYAFSDFHTNCKRRCYQKYQSQSMDFFYGQECRAQVQTVINHQSTLKLVPTASPTAAPSLSPTPANGDPTLTPTTAPSPNPSFSPTAKPTADPTTSPSAKPSPNPSASPTNSKQIPTAFPTEKPTSKPNPLPTPAPSVAPPSPLVQKYPFMYLMWNFRMFRNQACTSANLSIPISPSAQPTHLPTANPTAVPTAPTLNPTVNPTNPTESPTVSPTEAPSLVPTAAPSANPTFLPSYWQIPTHKPTHVPTATPTTAKPTSIPEIDQDNCWMKVSETLQGLTANAGAGGGGLPYDCFATDPNLGGFQPFILNGLYGKAFQQIGCCYGTIIQLIQQAQTKPAAPPFYLPPCILRYMIYQGITGTPGLFPSSGVPLAPTNVCPLGANANLSITEFSVKISRPKAQFNVLNYISVFNSTGNLALITAINTALIQTGLKLNVNLVGFPYYFPNYTKAYSTNIGVFNYQYYDNSGNALFTGSTVPANVYSLVNSSVSANFTVTIGFQGNIFSSYLPVIKNIIQSPFFGPILGKVIPQVCKTFYPQVFPTWPSLSALGSPTATTNPSLQQKAAVVQHTSVALPITPNSSGFSVRFGQQTWQLVLFCLLSVFAFLSKF